MDPIVFITGVLGLVFTLLILSYIVGDNPAFRLAIHAFIGIAAGYVMAIVLQQVIVSKMVLPLVTGPDLDRLVAGMAVFLGLWLLAKIVPRTEWVARPVVALLVGTGAAAAVAGAMLGTIYPQTMASINLGSIDVSSPDLLAQIFRGGVILLGTVATLAYFQFTLFGKNAAAGKRGRLMNIISLVGQVFIAITLGALFAGAYSAALTALIDRVQSNVAFINTLFFH